MKRLYKIQDEKLRLIGNSERSLPNTTRVKVAGTIFGLEELPENGNALRWAKSNTVVIDDSEIIYGDISLYDWVNGKLKLNAKRVGAEQRRSQLKTLYEKMTRIQSAVGEDGDWVRDQLNVIEMEIAVVEAKCLVED